MPPKDQNHIGTPVPITADVASPIAVAAPEEELHVPHKPAPAVVAPVVVATPTVPPAPLPAVGVTMSIEEEIAHKEEALLQFSNARTRIEEDSRALFSERKKLEDQLDPILLEEKLARQEVDAYEKQRLAATTSASARVAEQERWKREEKRRAIERTKWPIAEQLEAVTQKIKEIERTFKTVAADEESCSSAIEQLRIKVKQRDLQHELEQVTKEKDATAAEFERFHVEHARLDALLRDTIIHEDEAVRAEQLVEQKTEGVRTLYEEQVLSGERQKLEDARRKAEQERWTAEDAIPSIEHAALEVKKHLDEIANTEREIIAKLAALS